MREPDRRRRAGRAEDDLQSLLGAELHVALQPVEVELALLRFHERPGEFAHVDEFQVQLLDVGDVARPLVRRPRLGIVIDADAHQVGAGKNAESAWA